MFSILATTTLVATTSLKLLLVGDIFLDRHIDELTQKDNKRIEKENLTRKPGLPLYTYPFQGLNTLEKPKYDAWIGNLECPVSDKQSTKRQKEVELRFSCKKDYLPELSKYFEILSLANNHTDNMGEIGFKETKGHLEQNHIQYFGSYDNRENEICKIIEIENKATASSSNQKAIKVPIAFCGYHGVYSLPDKKQLAEIKKYSEKNFVIVYPHQGEEYKFIGNSYQKKIYRNMVDNGADLVVGSHPHVIQNVEIYKGKYIFYSLGNFIFDQAWSKTREHLVLEATLSSPDEFKNKKNIKINIKPLFTYANKDFITKKIELTDKQYQNKLQQIGFTPKK